MGRFQRAHRRPRAVDAPASAARSVSVLAVDDQPVFRRAARELIAATPGFEQIGEAASGAEALTLVARLRPDLVLLDVRMPGMDGIETARRLHRADPDTVVVLISVADVPDSEDSAAHLRKQDLSPHALRELWRRHHAPRPAR